jgi:hypothetical protein
MKPDLVSEIVTGQNNSNLTPDATSVAEGGKIAKPSKDGGTEFGI